jgi:hypothetical protein
VKLVAVLASALLALAGVTLVSPAQAQSSTVDASDVQVLPRHLEQTPTYGGFQLLDASPGYVLHGIHDITYDGRSHYTVLRAADGSVAWGDLDVSPDAQWSGLAGRYYVEKTAFGTFPPMTVRFFDVETHQLAGQFDLSSDETLVGIGPGWILTSRDIGAVGAPSYVLVIHRLDGSSVTLTGVSIDSSPYFSTDGTDAWVYDDGGPLYQVDAEAGTATLVPQPPGVTWSQVLVGPTKIFNIDDHYDGHVLVTSIDRADESATTYDVANPFLGITRFMPLGNGVAIYQDEGEPNGTLWPVDLASGSAGPAIVDHLSDARPMGDGKIAMVDRAQVPGSILVDDGSGLRTIGDLPHVSLGANRIAYDGTLRATWGDETTWSIDPGSTDPTWAQTPWTSQQRVTTSGGTTLVNDLDERGASTTHWHLTWPGGSRDLEADRVELGHGGEFAVVLPVGATSYQVQRVSTGEVVATPAVSTVSQPVVDGSWVWGWSSPGVLTGTDVDHPDSPPVSVDTGTTSASLVDVRGRWAMIASPNYIVVDIRQVVPPFTVANYDGTGSFSAPSLGAGFVVSAGFTYDAYHHVNGIDTTVTDLSPGHQIEHIVDPQSGLPPTRFTADEAGSPSLAYLDSHYQPKILHLPWLQQAPLTLPDTAPPVLDHVEATPPLIGSTTPTSARFSWSYTDPDSVPSPASGLASYTVRYRIRNLPDSFGAWSRLTSTSGASLSRLLAPGQEVCAQAKATDAAGNTSAWSDQQCTRIDGKAPILAAARGSGRFTAPDAEAGVSYRYHATDDDAVGSYDVQVRSASSGAGLGTWQWLLHRTTTTIVRHRTPPGSEWCFRFRARDDAGNVSAWSPARCSSIAIEDSAFYSPHDSSRRFSRLALDYSYRQLHFPGAWLKLRQPQVGHTLALWVLTGPRQGKADVYVGRTRVGVLHLTTPTRHRKLVLYPMPHTGRIKVVQRGWHPVGVDAMTVAR